MLSNTEKIQQELEHAGYPTTLFESPTGKRVIAFEYVITTGTHRGESVMIGVSDPDGDYPEYPPHWVHISPPISDGKQGAIENYTDSDGRAWLAMSRPPGDAWDQSATKHMSVYVREHIPRIWNDA